MKKVIWTGLLAGVMILVSDLLVGRGLEKLFPVVKTEYLSGIFRPWSDPRMMLYFLYPFILGVVLAFVWDKTKTLFVAETTGKRGRSFGWLAWFCLALPGMFVTYTSFIVSLTMVLIWTASGLVGMLLAGMVLAKTNS